ncbi:DUF2786 domain-containing protein [Rhodocyclus gracilis]|uniref:DUF2786 domain-containing protein n=1 Tax=Rhodocyclus tenuis TaxID=1066 RepID=A0A6L5JTP9_RHOTE|nr:DUF2786 domain-containing protein [Rhodocyclus gracilis]MQY50773.1 DUF2786 domain-containing protein [Rhodocyclus gracilis]
MTTERDKIIAKIRKCLALSASANEHEAEAALRQARKLMETHGVADLDIAAAEAAERRAKAGAKAKPAQWEASLAILTGEAFGCRVIFSQGWDRAKWEPIGEWAFIGTGAAPEIAQYAFSVLLRQVRRARSEHIKIKLKRCKTETKTRRADLFCEGWVDGVSRALGAFASSDAGSSAIEAFVAKRYGALDSLEARDRNAGRKLHDHEYDDAQAGHCSGRQAELNRGVGGGSAPLALE